MAWTIETNQAPDPIHWAVVTLPHFMYQVE